MRREVRLIPDTDGKYAVDTSGTIYRIKRDGHLSPLAVDISSGSARVMINGKHRIVHTIVANTFVVKEFPAQNCVCHLNGDKLDNRAENLQWMTQGQVSQHMRSLH